MSATLRSALRGLFQRMGLDVRRHRPAPSLVSPLVLYEVDAIFDIGRTDGLPALSARPRIRRSTQGRVKFSMRRGLGSGAVDHGDARFDIGHRFEDRGDVRFCMEYGIEDP